MKVKTTHPRTGQIKIVEMNEDEFAAMKILDPMITIVDDMTSAQIRASIKVNEETFKQASGQLREILDEPEPRRPYYLERMIVALNLCSDIAKHRAKLECDLQKAIQSGR